ncbi:MAG TPA: glycosyl hydrolase, partial [Saprospiraceae bacterium]|nr:glycosyl hydrolase [Saprospiraceae bacterium]
TDYGKNWTKISDGLPDHAFTRVVREDPARRDLLYCGTEVGVFVSFDGGKKWEPLQLNLPLTPITDLRVHQGDLIASTSGRSFWILDDLNVLQQHRPDAPPFALISPENAYLTNGGSPLNSSDEKFDGTAPYAGVNPANGIVLYYRLPQSAKDNKADTTLSLDIRDSAGQPVRTFSSKKDSLATEWDGGPSAIPALPNKPGLNRFVWDMRYPPMPGVPGTYFENSFAGHKAAPGQYTFTLSRGGQQVSATAQILPNPLYATTPADYAEYHRIMLDMEGKVRDMHHLINSVAAQREQLEQVLATLPKGDAKYAALHTEGQKLLDKMKAWDEEMVQRKSKAYDDVENYPNRFSANYMFMLNQTESDIPRVHQPSLDLKRELDAQWDKLKARAVQMQGQDLPALNRMLWEAGVGGVWKK